MCGRFTLTVHQLGSVAEQLEAVFDEDLQLSYRPRFNVAPGNTHPILRMKDGQRRLMPAAWGLINHWAKDRKAAFKQINARSETLSRRPAYREAYRARRCVVPADGFYEWRGPRKAREPVWFHPRAGGLLLLAGLYEGWSDPETGELLRTFTVITKAADEVVRPVHDRMPVILPREGVAGWLGDDDPAGLLRAEAGAELSMKCVSPRVNSALHDDPGLMDPNDPTVVKQLRMFG